jgi:hypothetical protein
LIDFSYLGVLSALSIHGEQELFVWGGISYLF